MKRHMGLSVLCTARPRSNSILSIRCDRSTRPAASDARLTRRTRWCPAVSTDRLLTALLSPGSPVPKHYSTQSSVQLTSPIHASGISRSSILL